ncbi:ankyrin-3, partial [Aplysia californica]|uniref:Ankyrin-3 n=1 Tax=Aplysia californica TaxID=6500 RepID=A0ABM0K751_APLCA
MSTQTPNKEPSSNNNSNSNSNNNSGNDSIQATDREKTTPVKRGDKGGELFTIEEVTSKTNSGDGVTPQESTMTSHTTGQDTDKGDKNEPGIDHHKDDPKAGQRAASGSSSGIGSKGSSETASGKMATGMTPLMMAVHENKQSICERMMEHGADVNDSTETKGLKLSARGQLSLVGRNFVVPAYITDGRTALHFAAAFSKDDIVRSLLSHEANPMKAGGDGMIPLFMALESGNIPVVKELLIHQTGPQIISRRHKEGHTAVHISTWEGDENSLRYLYSVGANFIVQDKLERMPLHIAAERGHTELVEFLISHCKATLTDRTKDGSTLIHIASKHGHPETALAFLKKGVPLLMPNKEGEAPIHCAAEINKSQAHGEFEDTDLVRLILVYHADLSVTTKLNGQAPLLVSSEQGHLDIVKILLKNQARVDIFDEAKKTSLHMAAQNGQREVCSALIKMNADTNATDVDE